ncbi:hypothetical protein B0H13DRAFT_1892869 [Mycena leptocephala]|nr:hypothetical protein B0H13DRAFT_1892869 [Mycena leptocephala]
MATRTGQLRRLAAKPQCVLPKVRPQSTQNSTSHPAFLCKVINGCNSPQTFALRDLFSSPQKSDIIVICLDVFTEFNLRGNRISEELTTRLQWVEPKWIFSLIGVDAFKNVIRSVSNPSVIGPGNYELVLKIRLCRVLRKPPKTRQNEEEEQDERQKGKEGGGRGGGGAGEVGEARRGEAGDLRGSHAALTAILEDQLQTWPVPPPDDGNAASTMVDTPSTRRRVRLLQLRRAKKPFLSCPPPKEKRKEKESHVEWKSSNSHFSASDLRPGRYAALEIGFLRDRNTRKTRTHYDHLVHSRTQNITPAVDESLMRSSPSVFPGTCGRCGRRRLRARARVHEAMQMQTAREPSTVGWKHMRSFKLKP